VGAPVKAHVHAAFTGQGVRDQVMVRVGRVMGLAADAPRDLSFDFVPGLVAEVEAPPSEMYVYYQRDIRAQAPGLRFEVTE
jgi:hypothetical protein